MDSSLEAFDQGFFVPGQGGVVNDLELYGTSLLAFGWLQAGPFASGLVQYDGQQWGDFEGGSRGRHHLGRHGARGYGLHRR